MMPEVDKTISGLTAFLECNSRKCDGCEYQDKNPGMPGGCKLDQYQVLEDALELLKEHESAEPDPTEHIVFGTNRKCSNCGKYLFPAGKFCPHCGRSVKWE